MIKEYGLAIFIFLLASAANSLAKDWPRWGGEDPGRNMYSPEQGLPFQFDRVPAKVGRVQIGEYSPTDGWSIFSDFRLAPWSGALPGRAGDRPSVLLDNGDSVPATLTGLGDGKLLMDSEAGPLEVSPKQVLGIDCGGIPKPARPMARVHLRDGSILQMDGCHFDGDELTGHSVSFGVFKIQREAIAELILHPAPPHFPCAFDAKSSEQEGHTTPPPPPEATSAKP